MKRHASACDGEKALELMDILELVPAPTYLQALFLGPIESVAGVERMVDRALALTVLHRTPRGADR
jgi:hypothetical protein